MDAECMKKILPRFIFINWVNVLHTSSTVSLSVPQKKKLEEIIKIKKGR